MPQNFTSAPENYEIHSFVSEGPDIVVTPAEHKGRGVLHSHSKDLHFTSHAAE